MDFRVGDVLAISCPFTETTVADTSGGYVFLRWPWWRSDPDAQWSVWDGTVAVARGPDSPDWPGELFRTEPSAELLTAGAACRVGIPTTVVHVIAAHRFDPPLETGRLPRPHREVVVLRHGVCEDVDAVDQGTGIDPDDDIPLTIEVLLRPYAFLNPGDDVADRDGRAWHFDHPWHWHPYDEHGGTPTWPLTLIGGTGPLDADRQDTVATSTRVGSHETEIARWRHTTHAEPPTR